MRFTSSDGVMSSSDPAVVQLWESIGARMAAEKASWIEILRAMGVKLAHPDDGWVKRDRNIFTRSWYPDFDDRPEVGDLMAFGSPPTHSHHYRSWLDVYSESPRRDAWRREKLEWHKDKPEAAADGYRIVRVTQVDRRRGVFGGSLQSFEFEDTGARVPPRAPKKRRWKR